MDAIGFCVFAGESVLSLKSQGISVIVWSFAK